MVLREQQALDLRATEACLQAFDQAPQPFARRGGQREHFAIGRRQPGDLIAAQPQGVHQCGQGGDREGLAEQAGEAVDVGTGIGSWSVGEIVTMIKSGVDKHSGQTLPVMPWPSFAHLTDADAEAMAAYLLSLPPVRHQVPANVRPGQRATAPFVHFGVYQSK